MEPRVPDNGSRLRYPPIFSAIAPRLAEILGANVIVENKAGGNTNIGSLYVAKAQPDGRTLLFAGTGITNTGPTTVAGDLGVSPGTAVTGFPPGIVLGTTHAADANALQAQSDVTIAYNDAAGRAPNTTFGAPTDLGGMTLPPGVYMSATSFGITGTLTLDGQGDPNAVFIFQAASTLITASSAGTAMSMPTSKSPSSG